VAHVDLLASKLVTVTAAYENWRLQSRELRGGETAASRSWAGAPRKAVVRPDTVAFDGDTVKFLHRNSGFDTFDLCVEQQGLQRVKEQLWNPLENLTFGGVLWGENFKPAGTQTGRYASTAFRAWRLQSKSPSRSHSLQVALHIANTSAPGEWAGGVRQIRRAADRAGAAARRNTREWWQSFWERSHVFISPDPPEPTSPAWQVGRNYQVFRYQLGCNAYGKYPTKFNGGLFTYDPEFVDPKKAFTPDHRQWGGGTFTAQNQRLVYWPMLKNGDFDLMDAQFDFYRRLLRNAEMRSRVYWDIDGACFTEQIENFGLPVAYEYGWKRKASVEPGVEDNAWVDYQWDTVFEFCQMMLDRHAYAGTDVKQDLPLIESCLRFYDEFYQQQSLKLNGQALSSDGKLVIYPGTACETYKDALNPSPTICALRRILLSLLALPDDQLPADDRRQWQNMLARIPAIGFRDMAGRETIAPAWKWSRIQNTELPQLYPVYPWGFYGVGRPGLDIAIDTWNFGIDRPEQKQIQSWHQDAIFCARLGLTREAAALTVQKMRDSGRRFPTWWGPGHDWVPDHNWGGSGMIGVQEMLLQAVDDKIYLLPAWPSDWEVDFKLHAPGRTTVEVGYRRGKLEKLEVAPPNRRKDVVLPDWLNPDSR